MNDAVQMPPVASHPAAEPLLWTCPACANSIPINSGFYVWCEKCDWNLTPQTPRANTSYFNKVYAQIGKRRGARLLESLSATPGRLPRDGAVVASYLVVSAILLLNLALLALGVWLLVTGWPLLIATVLALLSFGIVWMARPRIERASRYAVNRASFPALWALVDRVAGALGARPPHSLAVDWRFGASFGKVTWLGRSELRLGLPFVAILENDELVALIGHELAHGIKGDLRYGAWVGVALRSLGAWSKILRPDAIFNAEQGVVGLLMVPVNLIGLALSYIPTGIAWLLAHLMWARSQRAEYAADASGAEAGGTAGMLGLLEKTHYEDAFLRQVDRSARAHSRDFYSTWIECAAAIPERERERIRRSQRLAESRLDETHPPTAYRLQALAGSPSFNPTVTLTTEERAAIDAELRTLFPKTQSEVLQNYAGALSHT